MNLNLTPSVMNLDLAIWTRFRGNWGWSYRSRRIAAISNLGPTSIYRIDWMADRPDEHFPIRTRNVVVRTLCQMDVKTLKEKT